MSTNIFQNFLRNAQETLAPLPEMARRAERQPLAFVPGAADRSFAAAVRSLLHEREQQAGNSEPRSAEEARMQAQSSVSPTPIPQGMNAAQLELARLVNQHQGNTRNLGTTATNQFTQYQQSGGNAAPQPVQPQRRLEAPTRTPGPLPRGGVFHQFASNMLGGNDPNAFIQGYLDEVRGVSRQPGQTSSNTQSFSSFLDNLTVEQRQSMGENPEAAAVFMLNELGIPRNSYLANTFIERAVANAGRYTQGTQTSGGFAEYLWNDLNYLRSQGGEQTNQAQNQRLSDIANLRAMLTDPENQFYGLMLDIENEYSYDPQRAERELWVNFFLPFYSTDRTNTANDASALQFGRLWEQYQAERIAGTAPEAGFGQYLVDQNFMLFQELERGS